MAHFKAQTRSRHCSNSQVCTVIGFKAGGLRTTESVGKNIDSLRRYGDGAKAESAAHEWL